MAYYGTVAEADTYFSERLKSNAWNNSSEKEVALKQATRIIDRLNFIGCRAVADQDLEFPRGTDTEVPTDIEYACYEIAIKLLEGNTNVDADIDAQNVVRRRFDVIETEYNRNRQPLDHVLLGIPSAMAWSYLAPYVRDPRTIQINRIS